MDLAQAIQAISGSGLENASQIVGVLQQTQQELTTAQQSATSLTEERDRVVEHNNKLLGQKTSAKKEVDQLREKLAKLTAAYAEGGDDEDAALEKLQNLANEIKEVKEKLTAAEQARDAAIAEKGDLEKSLIYQQASVKLGVEKLLLEKILELPAERLVVSDDGVKVKDKDDKEVSFEDYLEGQPEEIRRIVSRSVNSDGGGDGGGGDDKGKGGGGPTAPPTSPPDSKGGAKQYLQAAGFTGPKKKAS